MFISQRAHAELRSTLNGLKIHRDDAFKRGLNVQANDYQRRIYPVQDTIAAHPPQKRDPAVVKLTLAAPDLITVSSFVTIVEAVQNAVTEFAEPREAPHTLLTIDLYRSTINADSHEVSCELTECRYPADTPDDSPITAAFSRLADSVDAAQARADAWPQHTSASAFNATRELMLALGLHNVSAKLHHRNRSIHISPDEGNAQAVLHMNHKRRPPVDHDPFPAA